MTPTQARDRAASLAPVDTAAAYAMARAIHDPWFGCQALAWVARYAPDDRVGRIAAESLAVSAAAEDSFKRVAAAAWPVRALVERAKVRALDRVVAGLLGAARQVEPAASRSEALFLLFQGVFPAAGELRQTVLEALVQSSLPPGHWRQERNIRDALLMMAKEDAVCADSYVGKLRDTKLAGQLRRQLSQREYLEPRPFFWVD